MRPRETEAKGKRVEKSMRFQMSEFLGTAMLSTKMELYNHPLANQLKAYDNAALVTPRGIHSVPSCG